MSDTIKWSFSTDRCFRRCQRQYFLSHIAAWHSTRDPVRREAFLAKQVKTLELWQGSIAHRAIEVDVIPALHERRAIDWDGVITRSRNMAERQRKFSAARRYREAGISKAQAGDDYCALASDEIESRVSDAEFEGVLADVERSLRNLSEMDELLREIQAAGKLWAELPVHVTYDLARIEVRLDLLYFRGFGQPTIVDWKVSESLGGSDADLQTALYAWALCRNSSWRVQRAADCELVEVQLLKKNVLRHQVTEETFERLEDRIYRSVHAMMALDQRRRYDLANLDDYELAANPNSCSLCSQRRLCQSLLRPGQRLPLETTKRLPKEREYATASPQLF